jgi:CRP/FNR family transcriptional regulator, cyclic AMP receptor protein
MRTRTRVNEHLARVDLFDGLNQRDLQVVAQLSTTLNLPAGTALAQQGTPGREFFVLLDGDVEVIDGDRLVATRGAGSHLGEIALLERRPRTATLVAKTPVTVAVADRREFASMIQQLPQVRRKLDASKAARLAEL